MCVGRAVSIHAPARGATSCDRHTLTPSIPFQSTRPHGARLQKRHKFIFDPEFQSTRPHGARPILGISCFRRLPVSIHAPARGATHDDSACKLRPFWFQSTRPHGARRAGSRSFRVRSQGFNPRARTGRDQGAPKIASQTACFNPRARTGRDGIEDDTLPPPDIVSIHAPARGATVCRWNGTGTAKKFQSTRPHGARPWTTPQATTSPTVSIHAPARGATDPPCNISSAIFVSIHAPARGATLPLGQ